MKLNFYKELHKNRKNLANNTSFLTDEKYNELVEVISELKAGRIKKQQNNKCICLKNNVLCTSKCHFSTTCCNK